MKKSWVVLLFLLFGILLCGDVLAVPIFSASKTSSDLSLSIGDFTNITYSFNTSGDASSYRKGVDVMLVLDITGSMAENSKLSAAKVAAISFIGFLDLSFDKLGIAYITSTPGIAFYLDYQDKDTLVSTINQLSAEGNTDIGTALYLSVKELQKSSGSNKYIVLMSDGKANVKPSNAPSGFLDQYKLANEGVAVSWTDIKGAVDYTLAVAKIAKYSGIKVYTVGFGDSELAVDAETLEEIANLTGGKNYFAPDGSTLKNVFDEIAIEFSSLSATNTYLLDTFSPGVSLQGTLPSGCILQSSVSGTLLNCSLGDFSLGDGKTFSINGVHLVQSANSLNVDSKVEYFNYLGEKKVIPLGLFPISNGIDDSVNCLLHRGICSSVFVSNAYVNISLFCLSGSCYVCNASAGYARSADGQSCRLVPSNEYCTNNNGVCSSANSIAGAFLNESFFCNSLGKKCFLCEDGFGLSSDGTQCVAIDPSRFCYNNQGTCSSTAITGSSSTDSYLCPRGQECYLCNSGFKWDEARARCVVDSIINPNLSNFCPNNNNGICFFSIPLNAQLNIQYSCENFQQCYSCKSGFLWNIFGSACVSAKSKEFDFSCVTDVFSAYWQDNKNASNIKGIFNASGDGMYSCLNLNYSDEWCCPRGFVCESGKCVLSPDSLSNVCHVLTGEDTCNYAPYRFAFEEMKLFEESYGEICSGEWINDTDSLGRACKTKHSCRCNWDDASKSCSLSISANSTCEGEKFTYCNFVDSSVQDFCDSENVADRFLVVKEVAIGNLNDPICTNRSVEYPCSQDLFSLPFFDKTTLMVSLLAIVGIYFILRRRS